MDIKEKVVYMKGKLEAMEPRLVHLPELLRQAINIA